MKITPDTFRRSIAALGFALAVFTAPLAAQAPAAAPDSLEISAGSMLREGQRVPATLKNVVDALVARYPDANIILAGTADVLIENITFRWGRADKGGDLHGVLVALSVSTGGKFEVIPSSGSSFVLGPVNPENHGQTHRRIEVLGLASYFGARAHVEMEVRQTQDMLELLKARTDAGLANRDELTQLQRQLEFMRQRLNGFIASPEEFIKQVNEVSRLAIRQLRPGEAAPDSDAPQFQFHPGAQLLIITGTDEKLAVVRQVVAALTAR